ncbi:MAG: hypothetical protein Q8N49_01150 [Candidatus Omnitrophota bacterium]|nr:hypothetical protein [Candidatus Omnitrophota bacterium]
MIYILETFKEKHIRNLLLFIVGFGFLFVFFYQVLVLYDFSKISFKVNLAEQIIDSRVYLLSGWTSGENKYDKDAIWNKEKSSTIAVFFPKKTTYQIKLRLFFSEKGLIRVYVNKELVITLKPAEIGKWQDFKFVVPYNLISRGFNKIRFINLSKNSAPVGYKDLRGTNYQRMLLAFPSGYVFFEKARWLSQREGVNVNWRLCLFGGFLLPIIWIIYSLWFFSLSKIKFIKVLWLDFFTYLPSIIILLAIYLSSRFFLYNQVFTQGAFLLVTIGLTSSTKAYQLYRYAQKPKIKAQINLIKEIIAAEITGSIFIIGFMVLLMICTFLLIFKQENIAGRVANWAYLLLVMGVILRLIQSFKE